MIRYYSVNMAGPYHIDNEIPCQDSFYVSYNDCGTYFAASADGLGSELFSEIGSRIAAKVSVEYCRDKYIEGMTFSEVRSIMNNAFVYAYKAILNEAKEANNPDDEYDTTLCLVIFDNGHVYFGQSGDSGIVALLNDGHYIQLTRQQRDEDGYVYPLCSGPNMWEFGELDGCASSVMLMTDGVWEQICPRVIKDESVNINVPLARMFMDRSESSPEEIEQLAEAAYKYMEAYPRRLLDDDKTVVVLFDPDNRASTLDPDYYSAPNWENIHKKSKQNLYPEAVKTNETHSITDPKDHVERINNSKESQTSQIVEKKDDRNSETSSEEQDAPDDEDCGMCARKPPPEIEPISIDSHKTQHKMRTGRAHTQTKGNHRKKADSVRDISIVVLLIGFSIAACLMNNFVKEHSPESCLGVFIICFIANSTVLLPAPSLLVVIEYSLIINPVAVALCGAAGASLGEMVGFYTGRHGGKLANNVLVKKIKNVIPKHPYLFVLAFSALPLPLFDVVGMISGAIKLNPLRFYTTCLLGKAIKMLTFVGIGQYILNFLR